MRAVVGALLAVFGCWSTPRMTIHRAERDIARAYARSAIQASRFRCRALSREVVVCRDRTYFPGVMPSSSIDEDIGGRVYLHIMP